MNDLTVARVTPLREPDHPDRGLPPSNAEAEQALLGAILINNTVYSRVAEFLAPEHFGYAVHGRIYVAIGKLIDRGEIADPITLKNLFDQDGALVEIGGAQYLAKLVQSAVTIINAEHYGRTIRDLHLRRELIAIGQDIVADAFSNDLDNPAPDQMERAEDKLARLATSGQAEGGLRSFAAAWNEMAIEAESAYQRRGLAGLATGFTDLDQVTGGLFPSDLIVVAGRPAMGKTALATNIAHNVAKARLAARGGRGRGPGDDNLAGAVVAYFSLEMADTQLAARIGSESSGVPSDRIRRGKVSEHEFSRFLSAGGELAGLPLYIDQSGTLGIGQIRARARRQQRRHGLGLIVVDYLQLLLSRERGTNRVAEVAEITRGLKALAKDLGVPILALSQLSRAVEGREDKRPMLSDLRESGSIEQDADLVIFIYREEYYLARAEPMRRDNETDDKFKLRWEDWRTRRDKIRNTADIIIAKHRHGPIDTVRLHFEAAVTRFGDLHEE
jgi:replicative DNA helicase